MKTWWNDKAWPWLKENGLKVFLPIVAVLGFVITLIAKLRPSATVIDPTAAADARAKMEREAREKAITEEHQRLEGELTEIKDEQKEDREKLEDEQADEVESLRGDPDELRNRMLRTRRGTHD